MTYKIKSVPKHDLFCIFLNAKNMRYDIKKTNGEYCFNVVPPRFSQDEVEINLFYEALKNL